MNLNQKESDLSKMRCSIPNKHLILIKLCKKDTEVSLLDDSCPCIVFLKGLRVAMASSALQSFLGPSPLWCIYNTTTHPKYNTYNHSFVEYPLRQRSILDKILDSVLDSLLQ